METWLLEYNEEQQMFHYNELNNGQPLNKKQQPNNKGWYTIYKGKTLEEVENQYIDLKLKPRKKYTLHQLLEKINNNGKD